MANILIVIDMQKEYISEGRRFFIPSYESSMKNALNMLNNARKKQWEIIHIKHYQNNDIFNPREKYSDFIEGFIPKYNERVFIKNKLSCFSNQDFLSYMESLSNHDDIYIMGYSSNLCCLATIVDAYCRGYHVNFVADASMAKPLADWDEKELHKAIIAILSVYATICPSSSI